MGQIDSGSKSSRLLASRRYTHNTLTTAQESFTNVLDLQASEIYTQASKIPSSSLPFSGSSQFTGSVGVTGSLDVSGTTSFGSLSDGKSLDLKWICVR